MYTSYIGAKFLEIYNRRENKNYSAEDFFEEVMYPTFFKGEKHLMHVANSPFFQRPADKDLKTSGLSKSDYQKQKLKQKIEQVAITGADASFYVGFSANGPDQTTAGQVTDINLNISSEELYASWIGNALAVRVEGSQCLLIDSEPVLWHLFEGWEVYQNYMDPIKDMAGRQIETWNGYWLAKGDLTITPSPPRKGAKLDTYPWVGVVARLLYWHAGESMPLYIFSLGQTNTTYGFITVCLRDIKRLQDAESAIHKSLFFGKENSSPFWERYPTDLSLREVCQLGEIGLRGLQPLDYGKILEGRFADTTINKKNASLFINFKIWLSAMLHNKVELQELASKLAAKLVSVENESSAKDRGKVADADTKVLFDARGITSFISALADFIRKHESASEVSLSVKNEILKLPADQFPLFKALLRFDYFYSKNRPALSI